MEDPKALDQAKRANEARKTLKDFKKRHGSDLFKGTDAKSHDVLIANKKEKFMQRIKDSSKKIKKTGKREYKEKA